MTWFLSLIVILILLILAAAFICFRLVFSVPSSRRGELDRPLPRGTQYAPYRSEILTMVQAVSLLPCEDVYTNSADGLRLHARYYHTQQDAPLQIMFHGYRSMPERDFCGGLRVALDEGYNVLLVDQRAHGRSEGKCLTFGIREQDDCLTWCEYAVRRFGAQTKIMLYGMSMGAATVLMAAGLPLPKNVVGIAADCGYSSPAAIIKKVLWDRHYPVGLFYPLIRLGGRLYGGFDTEAPGADEAMKHCTIPILFIHGEDDRFVPCEMSRENYRLCTSPNKQLLTVPGAGHGLSYLVDRQTYLDAVQRFQRSIQL